MPAGVGKIWSWQRTRYALPSFRRVSPSLDLEATITRCAELVANWQVNSAGILLDRGPAWLGNIIGGVCEWLQAWTTISRKKGRKLPMLTNLIVCLAYHFLMRRGSSFSEPPVLYGSKLTRKIGAKTVPINSKTNERAMPRVAFHYLSTCIVRIMLILHSR